MKKYLALILGVLFVLSFSATAFAIHAEIPSETQAVVGAGTVQIQLGGEIRSRGWYTDHITAKQPISSEESSWYDERVRLSMDATVEPGIKGFVMLETNGGTNTSTSDTYKWGGLNSKPNALNINEAWILYSGSGLLGFPSGLKIGHMPLALGEKQFFDHTKFGDDAIVFFMNPVKPLEVAFLTFKGYEGFQANTTDLDAYVALATYKLDDNNKIGANFTYLNEPNPGFFDNLKEMNLGLHANGNMAGFGYHGSLNIQGGSVGDPKTKFRGYAAMLGLNFNVNPVNLRVSAAYGSGDNNATDDKQKEFQTFLGDDQHYTLVYEYKVASAAGDVNKGLANTTYVNLGVDYAATKELKTSLDGYILRASKTASGVSKNVGWEVDAKIKYALAKNLTYQIDAGYLAAGNFYEDMNGTKNGATVLRHALTLSF